MIFTQRIPARYNVSVSLLDFDPKVHFFWRRGQRIIPKGHRKGHQEPTRFQIDDRPHSQIRITQQLSQVEIRAYCSEVPQSESQYTVKRQRMPEVVELQCGAISGRSFISETGHITVIFFLFRSDCCLLISCSLPHWRRHMLLKSQRSH